MAYVPDEESVMAVALGWQGAVDTDLKFSEFYGADHTVVVWFLPQYPNSYAGPIVSVNGDGTYLVGFGDRNTQRSAHLISRMQGAAGVHGVGSFRSRWYHLAVRRNGNEIGIFLNGKLAGAPLSITGGSPAGTLRLGRTVPKQGVDDQEAQFFGLLDDLAIYDVALSDADIRAQFVSKSHLSGAEAGLLAGWRFTPYVTFTPKLNRVAELSGQAAFVLNSSTWSDTDVALAPLPAHGAQHLPFLSGEAWVVAQGFASGGTHSGYAAFCWDFEKADVGRGWGDIYPNGSFQAPIYSTGAQEVTLVSDASPPVSPGDGESENLVQARGADRLVRSHLHLLKGTVRVSVGQQTKSGEPIGKISTEWRGTRPPPHLHFAVNPVAEDMVGSVTVPTAFSDYEVRQPNGSWTFVSLGIPKPDDVVRRTGSMSSWDHIGHANSITSMTGLSNNSYIGPPLHRKLYATTGDSKLWWRDPVDADVVWDPIGDTPGRVVGLSAAEDKLFAVTDDGNLWCRDPRPEHPSWSQIGRADLAVAMTATNGKLFVATSDNKLWWRDPIAGNASWAYIGDATNIVAMAATHGQLFAATRDNRLLWRDPIGTAGRWDHIGHANTVMGMAGIDGRLFAATGGNKLWVRSA